MAKLHEVGTRYHHGIAKTAIVGSIFDFLGEEIARIDFARDVLNMDFLKKMGFTDAIFTEVHVFGTFVCDGGGPGNTGFVVIVNWSALGAIKHMKVLS